MATSGRGQGGEGISPRVSHLGGSDTIAVTNKGFQTHLIWYIQQVNGGESYVEIEMHRFGDEDYRCRLNKFCNGFIIWDVKLSIKYGM